MNNKTTAGITIITPRIIRLILKLKKVPLLLD